AVDVGGVHAFGVFAGVLAGAAGKDLGRRPFVHLRRVRRDVGDEQLLRPLVPVDELRLAGALEVAEDLVMVLLSAAFLDGVALPRDVRVVVPAGVLPPPYLRSLPVGAEDE